MDAKQAFQVETPIEQPTKIDYRFLFDCINWKPGVQTDVVSEHYFLYLLVGFELKPLDFLRG